MKEAREEIEGKPLLMQQFNFSQFSNLSDMELQKRKEKILAEEMGKKKVLGVPTVESLCGEGIRRVIDETP